MYQTRRQAAMKKLKFFMDNRFIESETGDYMDVYNPSTGEVIARAPCCTESEVERVIASSRAAYREWSATPVKERVQVLYRVRALIEKNLDELTLLVATEHGKVLDEARGELLKAMEA